MPKYPDFRQVREFKATVIFFFPHSLCGCGMVEKANQKRKEEFQDVIGNERIVVLAGFASVEILVIASAKD